jgi:hypothetical protein
MALPEHSRLVCSECGWKSPADLQTDENAEGNLVLSLREEGASARDQSAADTSPTTA